MRNAHDSTPQPELINVFFFSVYSGFCASRKSSIVPSAARLLCLNYYISHHLFESYATKHLQCNLLADLERVVLRASNYLEMSNL